MAKRKNKKQPAGTISIREIRRRVRKPMPRPGGFHTSKKGKKGYSRKEKHKKGRNRHVVASFLDEEYF
jgi:hypothetical protein